MKLVLTQEIQLFRPSQVSGAGVVAGELPVVGGGVVTAADVGSTGAVWDAHSAAKQAAAHSSGSAGADIAASAARSRVSCGSRGVGLSPRQPRPASPCLASPGARWVTCRRRSLAAPRRPVGVGGEAGGGAAERGLAREPPSCPLAAAGRAA